MSTKSKPPAPIRISSKVGTTKPKPGAQAQAKTQDSTREAVAKTHRQIDERRLWGQKDYQIPGETEYSTERIHTKAEKIPVKEEDFVPTITPSGIAEEDLGIGFRQYSYAVEAGQELEARAPTKLPKKAAYNEEVKTPSVVKKEKSKVMKDAIKRIEDQKKKKPEPKKEKSQPPKPKPKKPVPKKEPKKPKGKSRRKRSSSSSSSSSEEETSYGVYHMDQQSAAGTAKGKCKEKEGLDFDFRPNSACCTEVSLTIEPDEDDPIEFALDNGITPMICCMMPPCLLVMPPSYPGGGMQCMPMPPQMMGAMGAAGMGGMQQQQIQQQQMQQQQMQQQQMQQQQQMMQMQTGMGGSMYGC